MNKLLDEKMRGLDCQRLELDEVWGFIGKKMRNFKERDDPTYGDVWTYCALDAETKLVPAYHVSSTRNIGTHSENAPVGTVAAHLGNLEREDV